MSLKKRRNQKRKSARLRKKNEKRVHSVYRYTQKSTGKTYIGQTNNVQRRKDQHEDPRT